MFSYKKITILLLALFLAGCSTLDKAPAKDIAPNFEESSSLDKEEARIEVDVSEINPREAIKNYLLSQEDFAWKTEEDGQNFCAFYPFNLVNELEVYLWVRCSEFAVDGSELKELAGISIPAKLTSLEDGKFSHVIPRDGSFYSQDIKEIFPKDFQKSMIDDKAMILANTHSDLIEAAKQYFDIDNFSSIPESLVQRCEVDSDCVTPFNYLIRSSCPYGSRCIDKVCEVVCEFDVSN